MLVSAESDEEKLLTASKVKSYGCQARRWWPGLVVGCGCAALALLLCRRNRAVPFSGWEEKAEISDSAPEFDNSWEDLISGSSCESMSLSSKSGGQGGTITCSMKGGKRFFTFPVGRFDIDSQVVVPANTAIEGHSNPNDPSAKKKSPHQATQTYFIATHGISDPEAVYCGTNGNMKQGDAQSLRIGFLLNSNTSVRNINFQGRDTTRPYDNGNLCGGGVFETPGCVSPGFGDGVGTDWVNKRIGCYDHAGKPNDLVTGDGKGVQNVIIENVRLNDLFLPTDPSKYSEGQGSQVAVWLAMTQDGSATKNVHVKNLVSMLTRGDGINFHGNVQQSVAEDCHIENTGDDIYAFWGAYAENFAQNVFRNNVGINPGVTRNYGYGICVAVYGVVDATITGTKCYDRGPDDWNTGQVPSGDPACLNGAYCNSCAIYVHDGWFGAVYPEGNSINLENNQYFYMAEPDKEIPASDRPMLRTDANSNAHIVTSA